MAKDLTSQPWIFDAAGQSYTRDATFSNEGASTAKPRHRIYIQQIKLDTGDGGDCLIEVASGGRRLLKLDNTPANDTLWVTIDELWEGIHITTLATNASLEVYHGRK